MLLASGCGDDAPTGPDAQAFCETWAADTGQIPEDSGDWDAYADAYDELAVLAPDDVRSDVETLAAAVRKVAEGSQVFDDIYNEPGTSEASDAYRVWTSEHCNDDGGYFPGG
jgi:hypothetical protein